MLKVSTLLIILLGIGFLAIIGVIIGLAVSGSKKKTITAVGEGSFFDGNTLQLIGYNLLVFLVCTITLGIAYPWMLCLLQGWQTKHTVIHGRRLKFNGHGHQLIGRYLLWCFLTLITFGIYGIWLGLGIKKWVVKHTVYADEDSSVQSYFSGGAGGFLGIHIFAFLLTVFTLGIGKAWADVKVLRWEAGHTHIGGSPMVFYGKGGQLFVKYLLFILLTPLTLGIYTIFFPVKLLKWQTQNTEAVYQTPEIQAKAREHESIAVQNFAKFRIAANDSEIAAMKSGYTGNETEEELKKLAGEGNPFAAYKLALILKGDSLIYEGEALTLLQMSAEASYHRALYDLACQLPSEQKIDTLISAAQNGNSDACWSLVGEYRDIGNLEQAAFWFKVSLEWEISEALANEAEYDKLVTEIALKLSEKHSISKKANTVAVVLGITGGIVALLAVLAVMAMFLGISPRLIRPKSASNLDAQLVQILSPEYMCGETFTFEGFAEGGENIKYHFSEDVFYDLEENALYFEFSPLDSKTNYVLSFGEHYRTNRLGTSGIYKVYIHPDYIIANDNTVWICHDLGSKAHVLNVSEGNTKQATEWLKDNYNININPFLVEATPNQ